MVLWLGVLYVTYEFRGVSCLLPVLRLSLFSDFPYITNIFRLTFLSNRASQPLQTWYGAWLGVLHIAYRIQVRQLPTSCFLT